MRLVQLSRQSIAFPSPEERYANPMACWRSAAISVRRVCLWPISTEFFPGFLLAIRFYGGPPIRGRCCGPGSSISAAA